MKKTELVKAALEILEDINHSIEVGDVKAQKEHDERVKRLSAYLERSKVSVQEE